MVERKIIAPWSVFAVCAVIVLMRFYVRIFRKRQHPTISDYLVVCGLAAHFVGCVLLVQLLAIYGQILGDGMMFRTVPDPHKLSMAMELAYITQIMGWTALWFVKYSFLAFYFDIISYAQKKLRVMLWVTAAWTVISYLVILFTWLFYCGNPQASWAAPPLTCDPVVQVPPQAIATAFNISSDLLIMLVPVFLIRSFTLSRRERTALVFVFAIGAVSILASAGKGITIFVATDNFKVVSSGQLITNLSSVETGAAIVAACLPTLRILVFRRDETSMRKRKEFEHQEGSGLSALKGKKGSKALSEGSADSYPKSVAGYYGSEATAHADEEWTAMGRDGLQPHSGLIFQTEHRV